MRIVCQQTILMKYHALFVIFEKEAKFVIVVVGTLRVKIETEEKTSQYRFYLDVENSF